jgi:hypothetical protein
MPSADTAKLACRQALLDFTAEIRRVARAEALAAAQENEAKLEERVHNLGKANKVLFGAIQVLNERNRVLLQKGEESDALRDQLEQARTEARRLTEANKVLQWHLQQQSASHGPGLGFGGDAIF